MTVRSLSFNYLHHPLAPIIFLTGGLLLSILILIFNAYLPSLTQLLIAGIIAAISFLYGRFFICGLFLGILSIGLNAALPYTKVFSDCQLTAHIIKPDYSQKHLGKNHQLLATNIICGKYRLPSQTVQYWDSSHKIENIIGQQFKASATLSPIHSRLNPYSFDYEKYLLSKRIRLSASHLSILGTAPETHSMIRIQNYVKNALSQQLSAENAAIILALLTGNRSALSYKQKKSMQETSTSHLLAISGLHLALIGGISWLLFQTIWGMSWVLSDKLSPRQAGAIATLIVITFYALFTGFDIPVQRAWIMFSLLILSWLFTRQMSSSSLLLAVCVVLFISPYSIVSVGFYFSFLATFIVLWAIRLPYPPLIQILCMQAIITLALLPITWFTFGIIPVSAFITNLLIIPWLGLWVLPWALTAIIAHSLSIDLAKPLWLLLDETTSMMWQVILSVEDWGGVLSLDTRPSLFAVIVAVLGIIFSLIKKNKYPVLLLFILFVPLHSSTPPEIIIADRAYTSALFHNGHDAILINPGRHYRQTNEAEMWSRYLKQQHLNLEAIVLADNKLSHISSTKWLLKNFPYASVVTLKYFPLPYPSSFCQSLKFDQLQLITQRQGKNCEANLRWQKYDIALFKSTDFAITKKALFIWEGKSYVTNNKGAIKVSISEKEAKLEQLREKKRLWRHP